MGAQMVSAERSRSAPCERPGVRKARAEIILWHELRGGQMLACDFDRDQRIGRDKLRLYCKALKLAIVIDRVISDDSDALRREQRRDARLAELGVNVLRFNDEEVVHNR